MNLGIDLGGTKIEILALDDKGKELHRKRTPTPKYNYQEILTTITKLVSETETKLNQKGSVGICTPGATSLETGLLKNSNTVCMNGMPFKTDLETKLQREIAIANDANCFALSEATDGSAEGAEVVFGVIVGTGTGGGIIVNGKTLTGCNSISGEWGHNPLPWPNSSELPGLECYCGKLGCIETWISGPGFLLNFNAANNIINNEHEDQQLPLTTKEIVAQAAQGNESCELAMKNYEDRMARSLSHLINILDPDVIVLGGGMSNIKRLYTNVPKIWHEYIFSDSIKTTLVSPIHGDSSGVRGAAWLAKTI